LIEEHGESTIIFRNSVIHITLKGAFNELGAKNFSKKSKEIISTFSHKRFMVLVNLLDLEGATPEAFNESNEFNKWLNKYKMIAKAIVITSQVIKSIDQHWVPAQAVQNIEYFEHESDAMNWLDTFCC